MAIFRIPDVLTSWLIVIGFYVLGGLFAQSVGWSVRKYLLPPQDVTARFTAKLLPWLPLLAILAMTLHTVEHHMAYGDIRTQRSQYAEEIDDLREVTISQIAQGRTVRVADDNVVAVAALHKEVFSSGERIEASRFGGK